MNGVHFRVRQDQNVYKLDNGFLRKARHVKSTQKRLKLKFLNILRKTIATVFVSILMQSIQVLYGFPVIFVVTCSWVVLVKNGRGLLDHRTLKSAVSEESELIK